MDKGQLEFKDSPSCLCHPPKNGENLWIDDLRIPPVQEGWTIWVRTASEAITALQNYQIVQVSFDHDLGREICDGQPSNGYDVAVFIEQNAETSKPIHWRVHSSNPPGRERIRQAMMSAERIWKRRNLI